MKTGRLLSAPLLVMIFAATASAHRLDEYLQATRIAVETDRINLEMDLTPGADVAEQILRTIDLDNNADISREEKQAYLDRLLDSLALNVDAQSMPLTVTEFLIPGIDEMRRGEGVLKLRATSTMPRAKAGKHRLTFDNAHWEKIGAYLVNALVPKDERVHITGQSRDMLQKKFSLEYTVSPAGSSVALGALPVLISLTMVAVLYTVARRLPRG